MKSILSSLLVMIIVTLVISSCKKADNSVNSDNTNVDNSDYFPATVGNYYKYNFQRTDSTGIPITGITNTRYQSPSGPAGNGVIYDIMQIDSISSNGFVNIYTSFFRKGDNGIYYFLDTTGFAENLPPEFAAYLPYLKIDQELLLLTSSLKDGDKWPVFKVNLEQGIALTVVDVEASYLGKENITLNLQSGTVTRPAVKIQYDFSLINPLNQTKQTVTAYGWFVANVGAVQWQGNALLLDVFTRGEINFADSTNTGSENLIDYNLK
jgi:archaellum component FlaG (FlaF/FlaG flagellin family)